MARAGGGRIFTGRRLHLFAVLLLVAVSALWLAVIMRAGEDAAEAEGRMVMVLFPPGAGLKEVFLATERAGGTIVGDTWLSNVWILHSERSGYPARLRAAGAWLVIDTAPFGQLTVPTCGGV